MTSHFSVRRLGFEAEDLLLRHKVIKLQAHHSLSDACGRHYARGGLASSRHVTWSDPLQSTLLISILAFQGAFPVEDLRTCQRRRSLLKSLTPGLVARVSERSKNSELSDRPCSHPLTDMVYYFKSNVVDPPAFIYVGKDKEESMQHFRIFPN